MNTNTTAINAMNNMSKADPAYWTKTLQSRLADGTGSTTGFTSTSLLEQALQQATWEGYAHPEISEGDIAFVTYDISGKIGVTPILPDGQYVLSDPKGTGKLSATSVAPAGAAEEVDFTVLICGIEEGELRAFTFHPGPPCRASTVQVGSVPVGTPLPGATLLERGITHAKVR